MHCNRAKLTKIRMVTQICQKIDLLVLVKKEAEKYFV